jgi:hypothetical protein
MWDGINWEKEGGGINILLKHNRQNELSSMDNIYEEGFYRTPDALP